MLSGVNSTYFFNHNDDKIQRSRMEFFSFLNNEFLTVNVVFVQESPFTPKLKQDARGEGWKMFP